MKRLLRWIVSLLAIVSFLMGVAHPMRVRTSRGLLLRGLKSVSEAAAPFAALLGGVTAVLARLLGATTASLMAAVGALLSARYVFTLSRKPCEDPVGLLRAGLDRLYAAQRVGLLPRRWNWQMPVPPCEPDWHRDQIYHVPNDRERTMPPLLCDLWLPPPQIPPTGIAVIYIHGGGYFTSTKDFGTRVPFRHLACQGHVIMDIDYRLAPSAGLFDMLSDVKHAIAWMKSNAEWLGARPDRIVLMGGSAGAHLAALAAYAPNHPRMTPPDLAEADLTVRGLISSYGILDLAETCVTLNSFLAPLPALRLPQNPLNLPLAAQALRFSAWVRDVEPAALRRHIRENTDLLLAGLDKSLFSLLGGGPAELPEEYRMVSALTYAGAGSPPTLLIQAAHDSVVPCEPARALFQKLRAADVPAVLYDLPETEHTFDLFLPRYSPPAQAALYAIERFLAYLT